MEYPKVFARIMYSETEDPQHPLFLIRVYDEIAPEGLITKLEEYGYHVEVDREPTILLSVAVRAVMKRCVIVDRLVDIIVAWHEELCGELQAVKTLYLQCDRPGFDMKKHTPAEDSPLMRVGLLKSLQRVAIENQDFEEAAKLRDQLWQAAIDTLV